MSPEITTIHNLSHHRVQHELLLQTKIEFINKNFQSLIVQWKLNDSSNDDTRYHDEPLHDIIQRYYRWLGTQPIPLSNQKEEYTAKSN
jgi:hypothetical protein